MQYVAPLEDLFTRSRLMILDFAQIPANLTPAENIQRYFQACATQGIDPKLPENRQAFNNRMLEACGVRYLVSRYGEDRRAMLAGSQIAAEGRTLHMGVDIFARELEKVYAPCDGTIVRTGLEPGVHSYGHYLILQPASTQNLYFFMGHLSRDLPTLGVVQAGQQIARLGDYINDENGGWSRHLHLQLIRTLPEAGQTPHGYSTRKNFASYSEIFPDPMPLFPEWSIQLPAALHA